MADLVLWIILILIVAILFAQIHKDQSTILGTVAIILFMIFVTVMVHRKLDIIVKLLEK